MEACEVEVILVEEVYMKVLEAHQVPRVRCNLKELTQKNEEILAELCHYSRYLACALQILQIRSMSSWESLSILTLNRRFNSRYTL